MIEIFDGYGHLAPQNIDAEEVEKLPEPERAALFECLKHARAAEEAEERVTIARKRVNDLMREHDAALAADHAANPPISKENALRAVIAANRPGYVPTKVKANEKTRKRLAVATEELAAARSELIQMDASARVLGAKRSDAILAYMNSKPKISAMDVHREMVAKQNATKLAMHLGEIPVPVPPPAPRYEIDRVLAQRGTQNSRTVKNPRRLIPTRGR